MGQFSNWPLVSAFTFAIGITGYFMLQTLITCLIWQYVEVILVV
jgi:hypothetical protein